MDAAIMPDNVEGNLTMLVIATARRLQSRSAPAACQICGSRNRRILYQVNPDACAILM
jgi:choline dehydrogenase-like flavoprotein